MKKRNGINELLRWLATKELVTSSEIHAWGHREFYTSAARRSREFVEQGFLTPLTEFQKEARKIETKCAVYEVNANKIKEHLTPRLF